MPKPSCTVDLRKKSFCQVCREPLPRQPSEALVALISEVRKAVGRRSSRQADASEVERLKAELCRRHTSETTNFQGRLRGCWQTSPDFQALPARLEQAFPAGSWWALFSRVAENEFFQEADVVYSEAKVTSKGFLELAKAGEKAIVG